VPFHGEPGENGKLCIGFSLQRNISRRELAEIINHLDSECWLYCQLWIFDVQLGS